MDGSERQLQSAIQPASLCESLSLLLRVKEIFVLHKTPRAPNEIIYQPRRGGAVEWSEKAEASSKAQAVSRTDVRRRNRNEIMRSRARSS